MVIIKLVNSVQKNIVRFKNSDNMYITFTDDINNNHSQATFKTSFGNAKLLPLSNPVNQNMYINPIENKYIDLEEPIQVNSNKANSENRAENLRGIDYLKGDNAFLKFIDETDRRDFNSGYANTNKEVIIITHGFNDTTIFAPKTEIKYPISYNGVRNTWIDIAKSLKSQKKDAIILVMDWSNLAGGSGPGPGNNGDLLKASSFISNTAKAVSNRLKEWGLNDGSKITMIGHSLGTYMTNEIGKEFQSKDGSGKIINKGLKNMILLDPASDWGSKTNFKDSTVLSSIKSMPLNYEMLGLFQINQIYVNSFDDYSDFSIAFGGRRSIAGNEGLMLTATESYWMSYDSPSIPYTAIHTFVNNSFLDINSKTKLKLINQVTLDYKDYNKNSSLTRKHEKDKNNYGFKQECELNLTNVNITNFWTVADSPINCDKTRNYNICPTPSPIESIPNKIKRLDCEKNTKDCTPKYDSCRDNDWQQMSWEDHNGIIVSDYTNTKVDIRNGFVKTQGLKRKLIK
jgi:Lipase